MLCSQRVPSETSACTVFARGDISPNMVLPCQFYSDVCPELTFQCLLTCKGKLKLDQNLKDLNTTLCVAVLVLFAMVLRSNSPAHYAALCLDDIGCH